MTDTYCFLHLRGEGGDIRQLDQALRSRVLPGWESAGVSAWGLWRGLFGVRSDELIVVASAAGSASPGAFLDVLENTAEVRYSALFEPTVRPDKRQPRNRPGLYVFRFFRVESRNVEEFVRLSSDAWTSFEHADVYAAEPQGLFREKTDALEHDMLLVTWYDGLQSWETSRQPDPAARERFARRRELTLNTEAIATMLVT